MEAFYNVWKTIFSFAFKYAFIGQNSPNSMIFSKQSGHTGEHYQLLVNLVYLVNPSSRSLLLARGYLFLF